MKFDMDEFSFQDEINLMNLNYQMKNQQSKENPILGFNEDTIYNKIENR